MTPFLRAWIQENLAHKKPRPPRTLQSAYAQGPMVGPRGGSVSYERGIPVCCHNRAHLARQQQQVMSLSAVDPAHASQSRPGSGRGFQMKVLETF